MSSLVCCFVTVVIPSFVWVLAEYFKMTSRNPFRQKNRFWMDLGCKKMTWVQLSCCFMFFSMELIQMMRVGVLGMILQDYLSKVVEWQVAGALMVWENGSVFAVDSRETGLSDHCWRIWFHFRILIMAIVRPDNMIFSKFPHPWDQQFCPFSSASMVIHQEVSLNQVRLRLDVSKDILTFKGDLNPLALLDQVRSNLIFAKITFYPES